MEGHQSSDTRGASGRHRARRSHYGMRSARRAPAALYRCWAEQRRLVPAYSERRGLWLSSSPTNWWRGERFSPRVSRPEDAGSVSRPEADIARVRRSAMPSVPYQLDGVEPIRVQTKRRLIRAWPHARAIRPNVVRWSRCRRGISKVLAAYPPPSTRRSPAARPTPTRYGFRACGELRLRDI